MQHDTEQRYIIAGLIALVVLVAIGLVVFTLLSSDRGKLGQANEDVTHKESVEVPELNWTGEVIRLDGKPVLHIDDFPDFITVRPGIAFGTSDKIIDAQISPNGKWIAVAVRGASHDFGFIYEVESDELTAVKFSYGGGVRVIGWKGDDEVVFEITTPKPATRQETITLPEDLAYYPDGQKRVDEAEEMSVYDKRMSILFRRNENGIYDHLYLVWEREHFGCSLCENRYYDHDGDGLNTMTEFLLFSDPNNADTDGDGVSDFEEILSNDHPSQRRKLTNEEAEIFPEIIRAFSSHSGTAVIYIKGERIRDHISLFQTEVPDDAKHFVLKLQSNYADDDVDGLKGALMVYFDDDLLYKFAGNTNGEIVTVPINIEKYRGQTTKLYYVLRSFGKKGGSINIVGGTFE